MYSGTAEVSIDEDEEMIDDDIVVSGISSCDSVSDTILQKMHRHYNSMSNLKSWLLSVSDSWTLQYGGAALVHSSSFCSVPLSRVQPLLPSYQ